MSDVKYSVMADASKMGPALRTDVQRAVDYAKQPLDDLVRRYERIQQAQRNAEARAGTTDLLDDPLRKLERQRAVFARAERTIKNELDGAGQAGERASRRVAESHKEVERGQKGITDRYREINRATQIWMRTGAVAAGAIASSFRLAAGEATRFERQFTQMNSATAATTRELRKVRDEYGQSVYQGVRTLDPIAAGAVRGVGGFFNTAISGIAGMMRGSQSEQAAADYYAAQDLAAAHEAVRINNVGTINKSFEAKRARLSGDEVKAFEIEGRMRLQQQNVEESARLVAGEISDQEFVAIVDGSKDLFERELEALKRRVKEQEQEIIDRKAAEELEIYLEGWALIREIDADNARKLEEENEKRLQVRERANQAFESNLSALSALEIDTALEDAKVQESRLRRMGLDREADRTRINAVFDAERANAKQQFGAIMDDALRGDVSDNDREAIWNRGNDALQARLRVLTAQQQEELLALDEAEKKVRENGRETGAGLVVGSGVGSDMAGRVFGAASPAVREAEKQTRKLDEINTTLKEIREKTGAASWN